MKRCGWHCCLFFKMPFNSHHRYQCIITFKLIVIIMLSTLFEANAWSVMLQYWSTWHELGVNVLTDMTFSLFQHCLEHPVFLSILLENTWHTRNTYSLCFFFRLETWKPYLDWPLNRYSLLSTRILIFSRQ